MKDEISLKFGTWKVMRLVTPECKSLFKEYQDLECSGATLTQNDSPRQVDLLCEIIKLSNADSIYQDWDCEYMSKYWSKRLEWQRDLRGRFY